MRILFILHQFYPEFSSGTEHVTLNLAKAAQRAGHYVHVLACMVNHSSSSKYKCEGLEGAQHIIHEGVPVTLLPRKLMSATVEWSFEIDNPLVEKLVHWMKLKHFNIAHVLHSMRMASALLAIQRCGLPYLVTLTDFFFMCYRISLINTHNQLCSGPQFGVHCAEKCLYVPWSNEGLMGRYQQADGLLGAAGVRICPSEYVADRYREAFPALEFSVIPHGINMLLLSNNTAPSPSVAGLTFGFIGTIVPQKGLTTLLRAFAAVPDPKLKLVVVGGFYCDPEYQREVQTLIDADHRIVLHGEVSTKQVYQILQTLDVLCLPSHVPESFSLVFNEAAAAGVPALVSDLGAPCERIAQFGGGKTLPVGDITAWAQAITELARHPETIESWCAELPLPLRIEEEAFFYESYYRRLQQPS